MKTPKEVLLEQHADAEAALNQVRRNALAALRPESAPGWREWLAAARWHWVGLGAVWAGIALLAVSERGGGPMIPPGAAKVPTRELVASLVESRRVLSELDSPPPAKPARHGALITNQIYI